MFAITPTTLATAGSAERFPVRRVYCVGRNYADHAREMGADPDREPPFYFTKPSDAVFTASEGHGGGPAHRVPYPPQTQKLHHEIELVVALAAGGADIDTASALQHVWGYGVGVDLTRRDLQDVAKQTRRPWDLSKGFDASGPVSELVAAESVDPTRGRIWLSVDDDLRQDGDLADQIWPVADVIAHLSKSVTLAPGDLITTGTPAGVGAISRGQQVRGGIDGVGEISFVVD
ncbi:MAG: fumarylacetoacetate hydrolase family protein [Mycobacterium sp.]|nr:fumarylacetoacetate hydrolase family protein [Mycobacterium sp.]